MEFRQVMIFAFCQYPETEMLVGLLNKQRKGLE